MSEGFQDNDYSLFNDFCFYVTAQLLELQPFKKSKNKINIWQYFKPSTDSGIGVNQPKNTAYKFYSIAGKSLVTNSPEKIIETLKEIQVGYSDENYNDQILGEEIWLDASHKGKMICVVVKEIEELHWTTTIYEPELRNNFTTNETYFDLIYLLPFSAISMWPYLNSPQPSDWKNIAAEILAREIGRVLGLAYEYEFPGSDYEIYRGDPLIFPNIFVQDFNVLKNIPSETLIPDIKWVEYIDNERKNKQVTFENHPTADYRTVHKKMKEQVVVLAHPDSTQPNYIQYRLLNYPNKPNLIEGGAGYRKGVFRPCVECLMRNPGHEITIEGKKKRISDKYCKICHEYIRKVLTGQFDIKIGARLGILNQPKKLVNSRLAEKFYEFLISNENLGLIPEYACVSSATKRINTFFKDILHWSGWYKNENSLPKYRQTTKDYTLAIQATWLNDPKPILRDYNAEIGEYAGCGFPGALAYEGFGYIVNTRVKTKVTTPDFEGEIWKTEQLRESDLASLPRGSLLQGWRQMSDYNRIQGFVFGYINTISDPLGHTMIYMGNNKIADQNGIDQDLPGHYIPSDNNLLIAAKWYDAENIP